MQSLSLIVYEVGSECGGFLGGGFLGGLMGGVVLGGRVVVVVWVMVVEGCRVLV